VPGDEENCSKRVQDICDAYRETELQATEETEPAERQVH